MKPKGDSIAHKLDLLLKKFPRADGEPWRGVEIEEATGGEVSSAYFSGLRKGKWKQPGMKQLSLIADVMGFPFELWRTDPEHWDDLLKTQRRTTGYRSPAGSMVAAHYTGAPDQATRLEEYVVPRIPYGQELAALLNMLFESKPDPATGASYTDQRVAELSRDRITAQEIAAMRDASYDSPPPEIKLIALSEVFEVSPSYWYAGDEDQAVLDLDVLEQMLRDDRVLVRRKSNDLSSSKRELVAMLLKNLDTDAGVDKSQDSHTESQ